ncbi:transmembrane protein fuseless isoform X2 [Amblyomma americanum]
MAVATAAAVATCDALLSLLVATPLVVAHWRAVWFLLDWFVLPQRPYVSGWLCLSLGHAAVLAAHLAQYALGSLGDDDDDYKRLRPRRPWRRFAARLYTPLLSVATIAQWRGVWILHDLFLEPVGPVPSALISLGAGCVGLALAGALKMVPASPPFAFGTDEPRAYFDAPTRLGCRPDKGGWLPFAADCALTVLVLQTLLISAWRGLWALLDATSRSAKASLASGSTAAVLLLAAQVPAGIVWRRLGGDDGGASKNAARGSLSWVQRAFEEFWHLAATYACVSIWRGIWMLVEEWLQEEVLAFALLAVGSFLLLQTVYAANNVLTRGVSLDGQGVAFDIAFLSELLTVPSSGLS